MEDREDRRRMKEFRDNPPEHAPGQSQGSRMSNADFKSMYKANVSEVSNRERQEREATMAPSPDLSAGGAGGAGLAGGGGPRASDLGGRSARTAGGGVAPQPGAGGAGGANTGVTGGAGPKPYEVPENLKGGTKIEKFFLEILLGIGRTLVAFIKSFKGVDIETSSRAGRSLMITGVIISFSAVVLILLSYIFKFKKPFALVAGGIFVTVMGLVLQMVIFGKTAEVAEPEKKEDDFISGSEEDIDSILNALNDGEEPVYSNTFGFEAVPDSNEDLEIDLFDEKEEIKTIDQGVSLENLNFFDGNIIQNQINIEDASKGLDAINPTMFTREFLFDRYMAFLPKANPNFSKVITIYRKGSNGNRKEDYEFASVFDYMEILLRESARAVGIKEENLPLLDKVEISQPLVKLYCKKDGLVRLSEIGEEFEKLYKYGDTGVAIDSRQSSSVKVNTFGSNFVLDLLKGEQLLVTLGDLLPNVKDFIVNPGNLLPIILGINEYGQIIYDDFKHKDSIIISGLPRSGKSLTMQSIVSQMCMFNSPKDIQFHIIDLKKDISDFQGIDCKHIRTKSFTVPDCLEVLNHLINVESVSRKEIMKQYGEINILSFKKNHPEVEMPFIYIVIDEMINLIDSMEKDDKASYKALLNTLVSSLPAAGIRAILMPHRIVDSVIPKNVSVLTPTRIAVGLNDEGEYLSAIGITKSKFGYNLTNKGDCAVILREYNSNKPFFCHSSIVSDRREDTVNLFNLINKVWENVKIDEIKLEQEGMLTREIPQNSDDIELDILSSAFDSGKGNSEWD